jgi:hypothetical protein
MRFRTSLLFVVLSFCLQGCGESPSGPQQDHPVPPPGPHYTVLPIPLDKLARITPLGFNNKPLPTDHTYWDTCDLWWLLPGSRPCVLERLPIRAPGSGVIVRLIAQEDGSIGIEGPPGLRATFGHVTPAPGLAIGDSVRAGDTIATMFFEHSFDFGILDYSITPHKFVNRERTHPGYEYAESPIAQFAEPVRSELIARVRTFADPLGRMSYDQAGTAAGAWFLEGTPVRESMNGDHAPNQLFLGRLQERDETRILTIGKSWPGQLDPLLAIDPAAPSWDQITTASGIVALKAWRLDRDGRPLADSVEGTILIEVLANERIRIEWFERHDPVTTFTADARIYER